MWTPTSRSQLMVWALVQRRHAKVGNLDLAVRFQQDILRLQIAMANVERVAVFKCAHDLAEVEYGFLFIEGAVPVDELEQISLFDIFGDQITGTGVSEIPSDASGRAVGLTFLSGSPIYQGV